MRMRPNPWEWFSFYDERKENLCFDDPALRYLSDEQAYEWLKFSAFDNIHTLSSEIRIISDNLHLLLDAQKNLTLVDLGCGDGIKSTQVYRLLSDRGANISAYHAIDINQVFIDTAKQQLCESGGLPPNRFFGHCTRIEDLSQLFSFPWNINSCSNARVLYLFLGNTFNNFVTRKCLTFIDKLLQHGTQMLIGAKIRTSSCDSEFTRIIEDYKSFGDAFTFSFGHLLGLADHEMSREVIYNYSANCVEIWLDLAKPLRHPSFPKIRSKRILVFRSFRPTSAELVKGLQEIACVSLWENRGGNDVILHCRR